MASALNGEVLPLGLVIRHQHLVWRATFGTQMFAGTGADGGGNGIVDATDYVLWRHAASVTTNALIAREAFTPPAVESNATTVLALLSKTLANETKNMIMRKPPTQFTAWLVGLSVILSTIIQPTNRVGNGTVR